MSHKMHAWLLVYRLVALVSIALWWRAWDERSQVWCSIGGGLLLLAEKDQAS